MEGKASQSGTVSGPAAAKREVRRMIRERVGGLDAAAREAMSRSICRRVSSLVREKNFRRVAVFAARPGEVDLLSLLDLLPDREWYFPLVHEGRRLSFHRVCHHGELVAGSCGRREPGPDTRRESVAVAGSGTMFQPMERINPTSPSVRVR